MYICIGIHKCMYLYIYTCGEDCYWLRSFNTESNESAVGETKQNVLVGPWAFVRALMGPPGPLWAGPLSHSSLPESILYFTKTYLLLYVLPNTLIVAFL